MYTRARAHTHTHTNTRARVCAYIHIHTYVYIYAHAGVRGSIKGIADTLEAMDPDFDAFGVATPSAGIAVCCSVL